MWPSPHGHGWTLLAWDKRSDGSGPGPRSVSNDHQTGNIRRLRTALNEAAASWAHPGLRVVRVLASKFRIPIRLNCQGMPDGRARTGQTVFFLLYFARCTVAEDRFRTRREAPVKSLCARSVERRSSVVTNPRSMSVGCATDPHAGSQSVLHCDGGALVLLFLGTFPRANLGATAVQYSAVVDSENVSVELVELGINTTVQKRRESWGVFTLRPKFTGNCCLSSKLKVFYSVISLKALTRRGKTQIQYHIPYQRGMAGALYDTASSTTVPRRSMYTDGSRGWWPSW